MIGRTQGVKQPRRSLGQITRPGQAEIAHYRAKPHQNLARPGLCRVKPDRRLGRIMRCKLAGCRGPGRIAGPRQRRAQHGLGILDRHATGPQQGGGAVTGNDRAFHAHRAGAAIQNGGYATRKALQHMFGAGGRDAPRRIGRRCGQRAAKGRQSGREGKGA